MIEIKKLKLNPGNPRKIVDAKMERLKKSIQDFERMMELQPIVVSEDFTVLGGNMRLQAIKQLGYKEIPEEWVKVAEGLTEEQKREFVIKDNVGFGEWDWEILGNEWEAEQLIEWGLDVPDWTGEQAEGQEDDYEIPDEIKTDIVPGDLIEIGEHRLLCGDSCDSDAVAKLMNGYKADLLLTDPPYGVSYTGRTKDNLTIQNDSLDEKGLKDLILGAFNNAELSLRAGAYWYATVPAGPLHLLFAQDWKDRGILRQIMVWVKDSLVLGHSEYHYRHEPILFGWSAGERKKNSDRTRDTVWEVARPKASREHPTMKPVELWSIPVNDGSQKGDIVYDPFLGSGTTMVAAHQLGRKCYGMEIDPKYCQVIVDRMLKLDPDIEVKINGNLYVRKEERATTDATQ